MSTTTEAEDTLWDLSHLVDGGGDDAVARMLEEGESRARDFAAAHAGKVADFDAATLETAMKELAAIYELVGKAGSYAMLSFAANMEDPARGALVQMAQEHGAAIETAMLFFDLEWQGLSDEQADALLDGAENLDFAAHYLRVLRRFAPYRLSEPEERILTELRVTGRSAWSRLFEEQLASTKLELDGEETSLEIALAKLYSDDRDERKAAAEAVTAGLEPGLRTRAYVFNTLLADKATEDRLRGLPHWLAARNLDNEASDESVEALVDTVASRYEIVRRWYRLKAKILKIDRLTDYDRYAGVGTSAGVIAWPQARDLVHETYRSFSPVLGDLVGRFFDERWIDVPTRPGKRPGAFSAATVPSVHPYVLLNFTGSRRDVLILAHELGHGVHQSLAGARGVFHQNTPLTVAETASVFGETLTFGRLLEQTTDPNERLSLLAEDIESTIATVFRQVAMHRFEASVHSERRSAGELPSDRIGELWVATQREMFEDSLEITDGYKTWWSYVHHFTASPGYVYAYAYGQLLALSVYQRYVEEGEAFVPRYLDMLAAGGSKSPEELGAIVGVDLADPGFWSAGLDLIERSLEQAEQAAAEAGAV